MNCDVCDISIPTTLFKAHEENHRRKLELQKWKEDRDVEEAEEATKTIEL